MEHTLEALLHEDLRPLERFASRGVTRRSTDASIVDVLERDQRQLLRLFEAITLYAEGDDERLAFFEQLRRELLAHMRAEEDATYPSLAADDEFLVAHSLAEHRHLTAALARLAQTPIGEGWKRQLDALRADLVTHVRNERKTLLPRAMQGFPLAEQITLGRAYETARNRHLEELAVRC